jgi:uncharacterized protein (DUF58 family)
VLQIDPEILSDIKSFDWAIRSLAQGPYFGVKSSRKLGAGIEFSQYRPYSQGDDLRQLDWKMYARSERFFIKQSQIESNVNITFILDTSNSMMYEENGLSKLDCAKLLTGVFAHLSLDHGDSISISTSQDHVHGQNKRHWSRILYVLSELKPTSRFSNPVINSRRSKELFVVLSDLYAQNQEWNDLIVDLKSPKNEVIVFHITGAKERSLDFGANPQFEDLETKGKVRLNADKFKQTYLTQFNTWVKDMQSRFASSGIDFFPITLNDPPADSINRFVAHRKKLA